MIGVDVSAPPAGKEAESEAAVTRMFYETTREAAPTAIFVPVGAFGKFEKQEALRLLIKDYATIFRRKWMNKLFPLTLAALCLAAPASAQISAFQHIILVIQENRTPDNMFQGLCQTTQAACSTSRRYGQYNIQTMAWLDKTCAHRHDQSNAPSSSASATISEHRHGAFVQIVRS